MPFKAVADDKFCDRFLHIRGSKSLSADHNHEISSFIWFLKAGTESENVVCCKYLVVHEGKSENVVCCKYLVAHEGLNWLSFLFIIHRAS